MKLNTRNITTGKLYLIIGKTNAGKDIVAKHILHNTKLKPITLYTTREKRPNEIYGVDYHFVNYEFFNSCCVNGSILEYRFYVTTKGRVYYFETINQVDLELDTDYLLICTAEAAQDLKTRFGCRNVVITYLYTDDFVRLQRYVAREALSAKPDALEICRRFLHESEEYEECNLKRLGVDLYLENNDLKQCVDTFLDSYERSLFD